MPTRHSARDVSGLRDFLAQHIRPGLGAEPQVLLTLARGPDSVIDLHDADGRALVAILTDACDNSGQAAELVLMACRDGVLAADTLAACLDAAIDEASRGPHSFLEIVVADVVHHHKDQLVSRGFAPRFEMVAMEKRGPHAPVVTPPGWAWADMAEVDGAGLRALSRAAFQGYPGVNFPPPGLVDEYFIGRSPPLRLLRDRGTLIGSVSVRRGPGGAGMIEIVQRHPDRAGQGVGAVLMTEALRQLQEAGCKPIHLETSVKNRRALALYERFGFEVEEVMPVYGRPTLRQRLHQTGA